MNIFECKHGVCFLCGFAAAFVAKAAAKNPKTRELTVKALVKGIRAKKQATVYVENLKEDAADLYHEAVVEADVVEL